MLNTEALISEGVQSEMFAIDAFSFTTKTYEKVLNGEIKAFSPYFFDKQNRRQRIVLLVRYLIEKKLNITPEEAVEVLTIDLLKKWKLVCLLKYIEDNKAIEYEMDKNYVAHLVYYAFPTVKQPTFEERVIKCYKAVLSGDRKCFPKNYFRDKFGEERAKYCFDYLWNDVLEIKYEDIPTTFLVDNGTGLNILQKYKLKILTQIIYFSVSDMILNMYPDIDLRSINKK